jgi:hypothetical protein
LPEHVVALGADAAVTVKMQLGCDEYQQTKHNGGITTCSVKNEYNKRVCAIAAHVGGDHQQSQKTNLATDPSSTTKSVYKQVQELADKGHLLVDALPGAPIWGEVKRLYVKLVALIVADWPAMLAMAGLGRPTLHMHAIFTLFTYVNYVFNLYAHRHTVHPPIAAQLRLLLIDVSCAEELGVSAIRKDHSWVTDAHRAEQQKLHCLVDTKLMRVFDPVRGFECLKAGAPHDCPHGGCRACKFWYVLQLHNVAPDWL